MLYDDMTYPKILERILGRIDKRVDKREGSVIYNAVAPAAAEIAIIYLELAYLLNRAFPDTATGDDLTKKVMERGLQRQPATKAIRKGVFQATDGTLLDIPIGSRFSGGDLNFVAVARITYGQFRMECETPGVHGNNYTGVLFPIDYIHNLATATLEDILIPGEDDESDEDLRKRYIDNLHAQPYGGNIADYKQKVEAIQGVGGAKITPVWNGPGTVKVDIISADWKTPNNELIQLAQTTLDPTQNDGEGRGVAPIGHVVTVEGVTSKTINITTTLTFDEDHNLTSTRDAIETAIETYFIELSRQWSNEEALVVRISHIENALLDVDGILDIQDTTIEGEQRNILLSSTEIPVRGTFNGS